MNLGEHAAFIWVSYGAFFGLLAAMIIFILWRGRNSERRLHQLQSQMDNSNSKAAE